MAGYDVIVVGGGNAGLVAAITARELGRSVLLLERAPTWLRGGNSRHTRDIRYAHAAGEPFTTGEAYPVEELLDDLLRVGGGASRRDMAELVVEKSCEVADWMSQHGVRWQAPLTGTLHLGRTNRFFLGGGKALVNTYYQCAESLGVEIRYETSVEDIAMQNDRVAAVRTAHGTIEARAVVLACGGFEANIDWLKQYWGAAADNYIVRGTPYNDGRVLKALLNNGAATAGNEKGFHAVAVDARAPKFDGGIATRLDSVPFGIVVNRDGCRFYDEGEEFWPKRYAIWGRLIAEQPDQTAYSIVDSQMIDQFLASLYRPYVADSIEDLATQLSLEPCALAATVRAFNASIRGGGTFDPAILDDCTTTGLTPPKSHWAVPIEKPPYYGYPLRTGVTFTYLGLAVDRSTRVMFQQQAAENVFAAGEIMSGNVLSSGYLGGFGLTIGTVFGRIAGREAATYASS